MAEVDDELDRMIGLERVRMLRECDASGRPTFTPFVSWPEEDEDGEEV